jgi:glycosyltransferase involved in cell wall biosynthesis
MQFAPQVKNIVSVSSFDAAFFRNLAPESRIWAIPNGILPKNTPTPTVTAADDPSVMIFTGDMSYLPNIDSVVWFTKKIFPIILKEVPWAKVQIVGREPRGEVLALRGYQNVEVKGHVPDLAASIAAAGFYILPMRLGSGIRSKLFDVFPLGKAIVSTSIGAGGLELHHDVNCIIADSAEDFAKGCIRLLKNESERRRLGKSVSSLASETYSQENVNRLVRKAVIDILRS